MAITRIIWVKKMIIQGWVKDLDTKNRVVWTQNKYNPMRIIVSKNNDFGWNITYLHQSFSTPRIKRKATKKSAIEHAVRDMRGLTVSPMNQRSRSR
jgi:hypothetical protein